MQNEVFLGWAFYGIISSFLTYFLSNFSSLFSTVCGFVNLATDPLKIILRHFVYKLVMHGRLSVPLDPTLRKVRISEYMMTSYALHNLLVIFIEINQMNGFQRHRLCAGNTKKNKSFSPPQPRTYPKLPTLCLIPSEPWGWALW